MRPLPLLLASCLLAAACSSSAAAGRLRPATCGAIAPLRACDGLLVAGSAPSREDLAAARVCGVRTVVDFRHAHEGNFDESVAARELGLRYERLPWSGPGEMTDDVLDRSRALLRTVERPALVHCAKGIRAGAVWLAWRALDGGLPVEDAAAEAREVGLTNAAVEAKVRDYVARRSGR